MAPAQSLHFQQQNALQSFNIFIIYHVVCPEK